MTLIKTKEEFLDRMFECFDDYPVDENGRDMFANGYEDTLDYPVLIIKVATVDGYHPIAHYKVFSQKEASILLSFLSLVKISVDQQ